MNGWLFGSFLFAFMLGMAVDRTLIRHDMDRIIDRRIFERELAFKRRCDLDLPKSRV